MIFLDSSVLIELFRKPEKKDTIFYELSKYENDFSISAITDYEIGIGNKSSDNNTWKDLFETLTVIPFDQVCSTTAIEIYLDLRKRNKLIDLADLLIGATALTHIIK